MQKLRHSRAVARLAARRCRRVDIKHFMGREIFVGLYADSSAGSRGNTADEFAVKEQKNSSMKPPALPDFTTKMV